MSWRFPFRTGFPKAIKQRGALRGGWILADSESTFILLFRGMSKTFLKKWQAPRFAEYHIFREREIYGEKFINFSSIKSAQLVWLGDFISRYIGEICDIVQIWKLRPVVQCELQYSTLQSVFYSLCTVFCCEEFLSLHTIVFHNFSPPTKAHLPGY